jgi:uncharacterized protein
LPVLSTFPELNVRTYVTAEGKPGIYFLSLDAGREWAVASARRFYKLPYFRARMVMRGRAAIQFSSERISDAGPSRSFVARYRPAGEPFVAAPGTLEYFLTERYCLYAADGGRILRAEAHHLPWWIQPAQAEIDENTMVPPPAKLPSQQPLLHYSLRQDVLVWPLRRIETEDTN